MDGHPALPGLAKVPEVAAVGTDQHQNYGIWKAAQEGAGLIGPTLYLSSIVIPKQQPFADECDGEL